jgi:hypothetical protein
LGERREVRISIGKRHYRLQTDLDESEFSRVADIVTQITDSMGDNLDLDQRLLLVCLQLAHSLEKISKKLEPLLERLKNTPYWDPAPEDRIYPASNSEE